jgi:hypothetical protein
MCGNVQIKVDGADRDLWHPVSPKARRSPRYRRLVVCEFRLRATRLVQVGTADTNNQLGDHLTLFDNMADTDSQVILIVEVYAQMALLFRPVEGVNRRLTVYLQ